MNLTLGSAPCRHVSKRVYALRTFLNDKKRLEIKCAQIAKIKGISMFEVKLSMYKEGRCQVGFDFEDNIFTEHQMKLYLDTFNFYECAQKSKNIKDCPIPKSF